MFKKSFLIKFFCLCFIIGVLVANFIKFDFDVFYLFIILLTLLVLLNFLSADKKTFKIVLLGLACFLLGIWRLTINKPEMNSGQVSYYQKQKIIFEGQVVAEPDIRSKNRQLTLGKIILFDEKNNSQPLKGKILLSAPNFPVYNYADNLKINCQLAAGGVIEDFDYGRYLAARGIFATCNFPETIQKKPGEITIFQKTILAILNFKTKYLEIIRQAISFPASEILTAMILGVERGLPENLIYKFRVVGLTHIMVVSGQNITILSGIIMNFLLAAGLRRRRAFYLACLCLLIFLIMIGFQASGMRAGIMGFLLLLAMQTGRLNKGGNLLLLAAIVLLLIRPELLMGDIGFLLSFLAVVGIMYLNEPINHALVKIKVTEKLAIRSSLSMTLSAQIMVLPLIVYYFGNLSLIAPVANMLVLPLIPHIMIGGLVLLILGLISAKLAMIFGLFITLGLKYIIFITDKLSAWPGASLTNLRLNWLWVLVIYFALGSLIYLLNRKKYASK